MFKDHLGQLSSVRVFSFMSLIVAILYTGTIAAAQILGKTIDNTLTIFVLLMWVAAAFCPKVIQKFAEAQMKNTLSKVNP